MQAIKWQTDRVTQTNKRTLHAVLFDGSDLLVGQYDNNNMHIYVNVVLVTKNFTNSEDI